MHLRHSKDRNAFARQRQIREHRVWHSLPRTTDAGNAIVTERERITRSQPENSAPCRFEVRPGPRPDPTPAPPQNAGSRAGALIHTLPAESGARQLVATMRPRRRLYRPCSVCSEPGRIRCGQSEGRLRPRPYRVIRPSALMLLAARATALLCPGGASVYYSAGVGRKERRQWQ